MTLDPDRRRQLDESKLRALVRAHLVTSGDESAATRELPALPGAATAVRDGDALWVLASGSPDRALGRALALAVRNDVAALHLVLDVDSGDDARRATLLRLPTSVWRADGRELVPVRPTPLTTPADPPAAPATAALVALLTDAGIDFVVEHGVIVGELRGLEVARVRVTESGEVSLDIGVGRFDQEAGALLHGDKPTAAALAAAVALVAEHRRAGAAPHAVNRLARERWLRAQILADPSVVGCRALSAISPPQPRRNVKDPVPAAAIGHDDEGRLTLVVCTVGVDLEWVPVAADLIDRERPERVVVAMPARDLLPTQRRLAALLRVPAELVAVDGDWPV